MSKEIGIGTKVRILGSVEEEYGNSFKNKTGEVLRIIRPDPNKSPDFIPLRVTVKLNGGLPVNFRPQDLEIIE